VLELLKAGIVKELQHVTWLANVVMVQKKYGRWRICTDYTDLNKHCPKNPFPLPNIDRLVHNSFRYGLLLFMDAYLGYNQIPIYPLDEEKISFVMD